MTGGELTLGMLDLTFNPYAKFYEAPMQMKATGGVFVIDDFGRQQTNPQDILNRWIIPLERGKDYLTLHTGKKFPVPFNELVVFSTNISPRNLADEGTLRRLYYKIEVPMPQENDYRKIFKNVCDQYNVTPFEQTIYVPHCIEVDGQIIKIFDESVHNEVEPLVASAKADDDSPSPTSKKADPRWVHCRRPVVVTGGELTLGMLDLTFNPYAKFYEAPMQMKATGGVFVIDDFGRQQTNPQDILNRWIIPLERGKDYLTLHTGKKFPVPFNELVVFSTNISPRNLADEGTLRRLYYKIEVPMPQGQLSAGSTAGDR